MGDEVDVKSSRSRFWGGDQIIYIYIYHTCMCIYIYMCVCEWMFL